MPRSRFLLSPSVWWIGLPAAAALAVSLEAAHLRFSRNDADDLPKSPVRRIAYVDPKAVGLTEPRPLPAELVASRPLPAADSSESALGNEVPAPSQPRASAEATDLVNDAANDRFETLAIAARRQADENRQVSGDATFGPVLTAPTIEIGEFASELPPWPPLDAEPIKTPPPPARPAVPAFDPPPLALPAGATPHSVPAPIEAPLAAQPHRGPYGGSPETPGYALPAQPPAANGAEADASRWSSVPLKSVLAPRADTSPNQTPPEVNHDVVAEHPVALPGAPESFGAARPYGAELRPESDYALPALPYGAAGLPPKPARSSLAGSSKYSLPIEARSIEEPTIQAPSIEPPRNAPVLAGPRDFSPPNFAPAAEDVGPADPGLANLAPSNPEPASAESLTIPDLNVVLGESAPVVEPSGRSAAGGVAKAAEKPERRRFGLPPADTVASLPEVSDAALREQVGQHLATAYRLAQRGALYSAKSEYKTALRVLAQSIDAAVGGSAHVEKLAAAFQAIEEADEFYTSDPRSQVNMNLASIVAAHRTPVLQDESLDGVTPLAAMQAYYDFAQRSLAEAVEQQPVAGEALYGLGKVYAALAKQPAQHGSRLHGAKAMLMYQVALAADPRHYLAANELGVMLARYGQPVEAKKALVQSVSIHGMPQNWHNLAVVHQQLGETELARLAQQEELAAIARDQATPRPLVVAEQDGHLQWIDVEQTLKQATQTAARPNNTAGRAAANERSASQSNMWNWLPWQR